MVARIKPKKKTAKRYKERPKPKGSKKVRRKIAKTMQRLASDRRGNGGQPTTYDADFARQAKELCQRGATDAELADFFGVTTSTIWNWSARHQEFFAALRAGKEAFDNRIERGLAQRAAGYSYDSEEIKMYEGDIIRVATRIHVPPSEKAAELWLTNRRPNDWKVRRTQEFDPNAPLKIIVEGGLPKE